MSDELRKAAERVRKCRETGGEAFEELYGAPEIEAYPRYVKDCDDIVDAYLATVQADDAEPVTEEWLVNEYGAYRIPVHGKGRPGLAIQFVVSMRVLVVAFYERTLYPQGIEEWAIVSHTGDHQWLPIGLVRRGQLRRLLSALRGDTP